MNSEGLQEGVQRLFATYEREPEHPMHVAHLALQIQAGFASQVSVSEEDREIMEGAAKLHDIGWTVVGSNGSGHHKATARLIRLYNWRDVPRLDVEKLALIARYHRKALPSQQHADYAALGLHEQKVVRFLGGIVRLADALDRRHLQRVKSVTVRIEADSVRVVLKGTDDLDAEMEAAYRKSDLLQQELGRRFEFQQESKGG